MLSRWTSDYYRRFGFKNPRSLWLRAPSSRYLSLGAIHGAPSLFTKDSKQMIMSLANLSVERDCRQAALSGFLRGVAVPAAPSPSTFRALANGFTSYKIRDQ